MVNTLLFIDTNILLDFYRVPQSDLSLDVFDLIQQKSSRLILSEQVKIEFLKNRSKEIKYCLDHLPINIKELARLPVIIDRTEKATSIRKNA